MRIIKISLFVFTLITAFSIGSAVYFNYSANNIYPVDCNESQCVHKFTPECSSDVYGESDNPEKYLDQLSGFRIISTKDLISNPWDRECLKEIIKRCQECVDKYSLVKDRKSSFEGYYYYLYFTAGISAVLTLIFSIAYLATKYSVVRTIGAISIIWIITASVEFGRLEELLLAVSPVILFWLYRFIRYGPSNMFKDK